MNLDVVYFSKVINVTVECVHMYKSDAVPGRVCRPARPAARGGGNGSIGSRQPVSKHPPDHVPG